MVTKKKQRKNEDFKKVKLKVGKKLTKTTTTDTTIKSKRVVLTAQLEEKTATDDKPLSFRGLTLDELSKQLGHFNKNIRKDAITGTKQLLTSRPDLITTHLRTLIPSIARLINDNTLDGPQQAQLKSLLQVICTVSTQAMAAHIGIFLAHVFRALSHMELPVRIFSLSVLSTLMSSYPTLCRTNVDLFPAFINLLGSTRKPAWNAPRFLDTILSFLNVFDVTRKPKVKVQEMDISFESGTIQCSDNDGYKHLFSQAEGKSPFDFPVVTSTKSAAVSPFELPSALLSLANVLAPIITTSILEDTGGAFLPQTVQLIETIGRAAANQPNAHLMGDFQLKTRESMETVRKAVSMRKGKSDKLRLASAWLMLDENS